MKEQMISLPLMVVKLACYEKYHTLGQHYTALISLVENSNFFTAIMQYFYVKLANFGRHLACMFSCFLHALPYHSHYQIICISQTPPHSIANSSPQFFFLSFFLLLPERTEDTSQHHTCLPQGQHSLGKYLREAWLFLLTQLATLEMFLECDSKGWPQHPGKYYVFKNRRPNFTLPTDWHKVLDVGNNTLALQIVAIFKRVTYILCGSNTDTLYI